MRIHQLAQDVNSKPEKGGGKSRIEPRVSRSIEEMYKRMLLNGEIQKAQLIKSNNIMSKDRAVMLMDSALPAPLYIGDGEIEKIQRNMGEIVDKEKKRRSKEKDKIVFNSKVNKEVEARLEIEKAKINSNDNQVVGG